MPNCPFRPLAWPYRPLQMHLTSFCAFHHPPQGLLTLIYATCLHQAHSNTKLQHWIKRGRTQIPNLIREWSQISLTTVFRGNVLSSITLLLNASVVDFPASSAQPALTGSCCFPLLHNSVLQLLELPRCCTFCWDQPLHPELLLDITQGSWWVFSLSLKPQSGLCLRSPQGEMHFSCPQWHLLI